MKDSSSVKNFILKNEGEHSQQLRQRIDYNIQGILINTPPQKKKKPGKLKV